MATSYLTAEELALANLWLKTVFFPSVKRPEFVTEEATSYVMSARYYGADVVRACSALYRAIVDRTFDSNGDLNTLFDTIANYTYYFDNAAPNKEYDKANQYRLKQKNCAKFLANMCVINNILWDDSKYTPQELEYFKKTYFGTALWDFHCFVTQEPLNNKIKVNINTGETNRAPRQSSSSNTSGGNAGNGAKLNKQNAGGLTAGTKVSASNSYVYWIGGDFINPGKTSPRAHVKPYNASSPLPVYFGSGQGYDDCLLYFEDPNVAADFLQKCTDAGLPSNVTNMQVKKVKTDTNGYFEVETQFGTALIKASKLQEALEEEWDIDVPEYKSDMTKEESLKAIQEACEALEDYLS